MSKKTVSAVERHLKRLARKHGVTMDDARITEARNNAKSYMTVDEKGRRIGPREAVELAEVHAFHVYGLPRKRAG